MNRGLARGWLVLLLLAAVPILFAEPVAARTAAKRVAKKPRAAKPAPVTKKKVAKDAAKPQATLTLSAKEVKPGDPVLVTVAGVAQRPKGHAAGTMLVFFPVKGGWQALFAVPLEDPPETLRVLVNGQLTGAVKVKEHTFPTESGIQVEPDYAAPPADKRDIVAADNHAVLAALTNREPAMFGVPFRKPGKGPMTSRFGAVRTFNEDPHKSRHLGQDIAARKGAPVRAIQRGKVALVRDGFLMGGTVVLVHGAGVASAYFHLADMKIKVGDVIPAGKVIGKVSLTGRTTGPHIHVGVWVPGGFVDPLVFRKLKIRTPLVPAEPTNAQTKKSETKKSDTKKSDTKKSAKPAKARRR